MNVGPTEVDDRLIEAIRAVDPHPDNVVGPPPELVTRRLREPEHDPSGHRQSWLRPLAALAPVAVALAIAAAAVTLLGHNRASSPRPAGHPAAAIRPCRSGLQVGVLPIWARAGFSDPRPRTENVVGRQDRIAAILFGRRSYLDSPPAADHNNKILWVSRVRTRPGERLSIGAQLMRGTRRVGVPVNRTVLGGPGPSIINLPAPGCWRLTLRWSGWTDQIDLSYVHPS
jgi:hypothetical protein